MVADALSRKSIATVLKEQKPILRDPQRIEREIIPVGDVTARLSALVLQPTLLKRIRESQQEDSYFN